MQFEPAFGQLPGQAPAQHLTRLMGRGRALEVMLGADDDDAELAERYGWINRALPAHALDDFVSSLAHRIAAFPAAGHAVVKDRVNAIALAPVEDFRRDSDLFGAGVGTPEVRRRIGLSLKHGFQTRDAELALARMLGELTAPPAPSAQPPCGRNPLPTLRSASRMFTSPARPIITYTTVYQARDHEPRASEPRARPPVEPGDSPARDYPRGSCRNEGFPDANYTLARRTVCA